MKRAGIKPLAKSSRHKMSMSPSLYFPTAVIGLVKNHSGQTSAREKRRRHASLRTTYALGTPHISVLYNLSFLELGSEQNHSVRRVQAVPIYHFGVGMMLDKLHLQRISPVPPTTGKLPHSHVETDSSQLKFPDGGDL